MTETRPAESADAKSDPAESGLSDAELTALALQDAPPDDFVGSETKPKDPIASEPSRSPVLWLGACLMIGLIAALLVYVPRIQSHEVARQRSPDGATDAVLMDVPHDAAGAHSYRVCLQLRTSGLKPALLDCREVAYLSGVSGDRGSQPVMLVWPSSAQLEIRYANATSARVSQPVLTWGSPRSPTRIGTRVILIRAVQVR